MPSLKPYALPAAVAAIVGAVVSLTRRFSALVVELFGTAPTVELLSWYAVGARAVAFVLVYGLLLGSTYWVAVRAPHPNGDSIAGLATGVPGGLGYAIATLATVLFAGVSYPGWAFLLATTLGSGVAVGVELGVVGFAGAAIARRRTDRE